MPHATFLPPDLGAFCRLDELGLQVVGQRLEPGRAVLACRVAETDEFARWCRRSRCEAAPRDSVTRRLAHEPLGRHGHPRVLRPARHVERPDRGHQRQARTPPRQRPRIPEPDELHRSLVARSRRIQTPTTPSIAMSLESAAETCRDPWRGALASWHLIALSSASVLRSSPNGRPTGCLERGQAVLTLSLDPPQNYSGGSRLSAQT